MVRGGQEISQLHMINYFRSHREMYLNYYKPGINKGDEPKIPLGSVSIFILVINPYIEGSNFRPFSSMGLKIIHYFPPYYSQHSLYTCLRVRHPRMINIWNKAHDFMHTLYWYRYDCDVYQQIQSGVQAIRAMLHTYNGRDRSHSQMALSIA